MKNLLKNRRFRQVLWAGAFAALAWRVRRGLADLDKPVPKDQPAIWPPLAFDPPTT
jgi:hypothetical protein